MSRAAPRSVRERSRDAGSRRLTIEADSARAAIAWAHTARFLITASRLDELPVTVPLPGRAEGGPAPSGSSERSERGGTVLPEVAFVGRSNAGKSTAINTLAQHRRLAFASRTPGRTQHINLFALGPKDAPDALWADLPGYGYAAVERAAKLRWQEVMADYLVTRRGLIGVVMLVDARLGFTDLDLRLLEWIASRVGSGEVRLLALLTKADKLSRREGQAALDAARLQLAEGASEDADISVALFSALARTGVADVAQLLHAWAREGAREVTPV
jgi:GTP-binding protein